MVEAAAAVYLGHLGPHVIGLVAHGSALKGGFIPGGSDVDLQLYLADAAFAEQGRLSLAVCLAIQRALAGVDPAPFRYIQCHALPSRLLPGQVGPVPGAYHVVAGRLPVPEATAARLRWAAESALAGLDPTPAFVTGALLEHGGGRLSAAVRLLCTKVWPTVYHVLTLEREDAFAVWRLPKDRAIVLTPPDTAFGRALREFHAAVHAYYPAEASVEQALAVVERGVAVLHAASARYGETRDATRRAAKPRS